MNTVNLLKIFFFCFLLLSHWNILYFLDKHCMIDPLLGFGSLITVAGGALQKFFLKDLFIFLLVCMTDCFSCLYVCIPHTLPVPMEVKVRREHWVCWVLSYRCTATQVLTTQLQSSARATSAPNLWVISLAPWRCPFHPGRVPWLWMAQFWPLTLRQTQGMIDQSAIQAF